MGGGAAGDDKLDGGLGVIAEGSWVDAKDRINDICGAINRTRREECRTAVEKDDIIGRTAKSTGSEGTSRMSRSGSADVCTQPEERTVRDS